MKRFKKVVLGMLMMSLLVSGMITSQAIPATAAIESEKQSGVVSICSSVSSPLSEIQYKKFMSYLTEEFAPEMKSEWEKALEERQSVQPVCEITVTEGTITLSDGINIDGQTTIGAGDLEITPVSAEDLKEMLDKADLPEGATVEAFTVNSSSTDQKSLSIIAVGKSDTKVVKSEPGTDNEASQKENVTVSISTAGGPGSDENFKNQLNLQDELDQAITSNDSKAINTVLGKMLTNYKQITEDIKSNLAKVETTDK